jgi:DNA-binding CsgD family transcriptional regulator
MTNAPMRKDLNHPGNIRAMSNLTSRECDVIDALLAGHTTTPELKAALGIGDNMVETHFTRIYKKTGTHRQITLTSHLSLV